MAKKKQELTSDELLAQALVREEDWPYEVPGNWVWTYGKVIFKPMTSKKPTGEHFEYIDIDAIDNQFKQVSQSKTIETSKAPSRARRELKTDDVLFSLVRPYLENIAYIDDSLEHCIASTGFFVCRPTEIIIGKYLYYLMISEYVVKGLNSFMKGDNSPSIRKDDIEGFSYPLPPLAEQQRIVDRIESLFDKLDQAKDLIQEALYSFETRKAAILHQAFTGELTKSRLYEKTNILNNMEKVKNDLIGRKIIQRPKKIEPILETDKEAITPKLWQIVKLGEIAFVTKLAGFEYTKYIHLEESGEIPVIRAQNVRSGYLDLRNLLYINSETSGLLNRSALYKKCLVITFIGAGIGDISIFDSEKRYHLAPNVAKIELYNTDEKEYVLSEFLLYYLLSPLGQKQVFKHMKATAQPSLSMATIRDIVVPLPSIEEQQEIVRILDDLFAKEQNAKDLCVLIDQIEVIKKTILGQAFRGELGTNDAGEESAVELLKITLAV